ncbi:vomeronasal type-1 receptor 4-like [Dromiciops gliroides]|uniref:vomeronasal type-1 receptor 4-like n=1 Tax=Dromiciops gliroides TaxID=33562 RepID=UPI001CC3B27A|nr:vomeronasal type-1 receptor 4-like [Dromiciops gliroides]
MNFCEDFLCIFYILQIIIGNLGNSLLLYIYGSNSLSGQRKKPIHLIFINLAFSNILVILFRGVPFVIQACIHKVFFSDIGCKMLVYLQRVSRGLSLGTTCLMSFFQAITITSCSAKWAELKARTSQCTVESCVFICVLNLLIDVIVPLYVTASRNSTNIMLNSNLGYCSINRYALTTLKIVMWKLFYDSVFVVFMAITSGYMVFVLYRHHQQIQQIHDISLKSSASPEMRATKIILFLMIIFVFFYSLSSSFFIVMDISKATKQCMIHISDLFTLCYPTASPFVLIYSDSQTPSCCNALKRMKKPYPHPLRSPDKHV